MDFRYDARKLDPKIVSFLQSKELPKNPREYGTWRLEIETSDPHRLIKDYLRNDGKIINGKVETYFPLAEILQLTSDEKAPIKYVKMLD
ncbi:MAG TPA: hypothetical protein VJH34_01205 [archaeon]|nr:hypothetical protein [archaeon]